MKSSAVTFAFGLLALAAPQIDVRAADVEAGRAAFETCRGCHSSPGYSNVYPTYYVPKVGGQRSDYIVSALTAYKKNERPHGTMKANAYDLSEKTMENIAQYLESSEGPAHPSPAKGDAGIGEKLAESCLSCHSEGPDAASNIPRLAGQYGNYLVKAMKEYQSGKRNNALMQAMVKDLSDNDLENISAYFAGLEGLSTVE
ncbi:MAG: cytochrome c family protein [Gammaproteobacteria bacterium HGW-Gammaproteobacteria-3]|nr:MAG: cytochrome c family protein [Gammaproteobacteria bacterium HGW-Gammaproteobacteria-3]